MTAPQTAAPTPAPEQKQNDKELNFRKLEETYERKLAQERAARLEAEKAAQEAMARKSVADDEDDDSEPYIDHKKLAKKFSSFEKKLEEKIDKRAEEKARSMIEKNRQESWLKNNPDFVEIIEKHADSLAKTDPELAETIMAMPDPFERQKLAYKSIKAMGLHKPVVKESSVQEKIDANRRSPYYQPSGVGNAPYTSQGDFSQDGQKRAYEKMKELKSRFGS